MDVSHEGFPFDVLKVIQRGEMLMIFDKNNHLFLTIWFNPNPLRMNQMRFMCIPPLEELQILSESMDR